ncbi:hypothetical protein WMY93_026086 [Mugilogobius chulae]|uniref:Elongator complex protein 6 n=1 Tax=Mugilogobius chulae TaxID=88201 RepID=A0AAW0N272_9GOBI
MFAELNSILNNFPEKFSQEEFIIISERRCDASFLIHHFCLFIYEGVSLVQAKEKGQLVFLEGLQESLSHLIPQEGQAGSDTLNFLRDPTQGLKNLFEFVRASCSSPEGASVSSEEWGPPVLLVDDLSVLLSLGVNAGAVLDFSHYCRATVCSKLQGNVVMLLHCDEEDDGDDEGSEQLLKGLTHQCSLALDVQGLPTGYCRDIHGQMEVIWRRRQADGQHTLKKLFQYKVHDKGASFFARGTSSAVL